MQPHSSYEEVLGIVCAELQKMFPQEGPITGATDMTKDLPLDSAGTMTLMFELETKLDVSLPLNDLAGLTRVHELAELIVKLRQPPAAG